MTILEIKREWERAQKHLATLEKEINPTDDKDMWFLVDDSDIKRIERAEREVSQWKFAYIEKENQLHDIIGSYGFILKGKGEVSGETFAEEIAKVYSTENAYNQWAVSEVRANIKIIACQYNGTAKYQYK